MRTILFARKGALLFSLWLTVLSLVAFTAEAEILPGNPELARRIVPQGAVLLRNKADALPLLHGEKIAVFGSGQLAFQPGGHGSAFLSCTPVTAPLDALRREADSGNFQLEQETEKAYRANRNLKVTPEFVKRARSGADTAIIVLSRSSREGRDRSPGLGGWLLTPEEEEMFHSINEARFKKTVVILNTPGSVDTSFLDRFRIDALLLIHMPGMAGGEALADLLTGRAYPSGKLTATWMKTLAAHPSIASLNESTAYVNYYEDIFVGYRWFSTFDPAGEGVRFPFGFGLGYTSFEIGAIEAKHDKSTITVTASVRNTGKRSGREVLQLYFAAPQGKLGRPGAELAAFAKTPELAPDAECKLELSIAIDQMAAYDDTGRSGNPSCWVLEAGDYRLLLGNSLPDAMKRPVLTFRQAELRVVQRLSEKLAPQKLPRRLLADGSYETLRGPRPTVIRPDRAVRIEGEAFCASHPAVRIERFPGGRCLTHMSGPDRRFVEYLLQVEQQGRYSLLLNAANGNRPVPDLMLLSVNGRMQQVKIAVPQSSSGVGGNPWYNFVNLKPITVDLPAGEVRLRFISNGNFVNVDYFLLAPEEGSSAKFVEFTQKKGPVRNRKRRSQLNFVRLELQQQKSGRIDDFLDQFSDEDLVDLLGGGAGRILRGTGSIGVSAAFGIPGADTADGPAGLRLDVPTTWWPNSTLLASCWDTAVAVNFGRAVGREARLNHVDIWLAPGMNIQRTPLCGRNFEYYSEDPLLSGKVAAAVAVGAAGAGISVAYKHFACNNVERNRSNSDSRVSERALREIYLRGFQIALRESPGLFVMSSYNLINGTESAESVELLEDILRGEWEFKGVVITDWKNNSSHSAEIAAGNDVKMPEGNKKELLAALRSGRLDRATILRSARRVVITMLKLRAMQKIADSSSGSPSRK